MNKRHDEMFDLRNDGKTLDEIGKIYGISRERVRQIIGNTGREYRFKIRRNKLIKFREKGMRICEIAIATGFSQDQVSMSIGDVPRFINGTRRCSKCMRVLQEKDFYTKKCKVCRACTIKKAGEKGKKWIAIHKDSSDYKKKQNARQKTYRLIKCGKIKKTDCEMKNSFCLGRIEAHHYAGYDNPELVKFYCAKHHKSIDGAYWGRRNMVNLSWSTGGDNG